MEYAKVMICDWRGFYLKMRHILSVEHPTLEDIKDIRASLLQIEDVAQGTEK